MSLHRFFDRDSGEWVERDGQGGYRTVQLPELTKAQMRVLDTSYRAGRCRLPSANYRRAADALARKGLGRREGAYFFPPSDERPAEG